MVLMALIGLVIGVALASIASRRGWGVLPWGLFGIDFIISFVAGFESGYTGQPLSSTVDIIGVHAKFVRQLAEQAPMPAYRRRGSRLC